MVRNCRNQRILNQIIRDTFSEHKLGNGILDWRVITQGASEKILDKACLMDGTSLFPLIDLFNKWLDQIIHDESADT